jgi:mRNA interferase YafQ
MMLQIRYLSQFKKDCMRMEKRSSDMQNLRSVIAKLVMNEPLETKYKDHPMQGKYAGARDCHITPDWILIYTIVGNEPHLIRTGSLSDLFS